MICNFKEYNFFICKTKTHLTKSINDFREPWIHIFNIQVKKLILKIRLKKLNFLKDQNR